MGWLRGGHVFVVTLCLTGWVAGCKPKQTAAAQKIVVRYMEAQAAMAGRMSQSEYIAIIRGETETELSFKVPGVLERIGPEGGSQEWQEGDSITNNQVLAQLNQADFLAREQAAWARMNLASNVYQRSVQLHHSGAISQQELDVAAANKQASEAEWAQARQATNDSVIRAPFNGTILARLANPGETISVGKVVLKVADLSHMSVELGVPDKLVDQIKPGQEIPVKVSALEGLSFVGHVSEVGVAAKEGARLFKVVIKMDNPDGRLKSGMSASVVLGDEYRFPEGSVLVPLSALITASRGPPNQLAVFVIDDTGNARERWVKTDDMVPMTDERHRHATFLRSSVVVTEGVKPGDKVVTVGASNLYDGAPVDARLAEPP